MLDLVGDWSYTGGLAIVDPSCLSRKDAAKRPQWLVTHLMPIAS